MTFSIFIETTSDKFYNYIQDAVNKAPRERFNLENHPHLHSLLSNLPKLADWKKVQPLKAGPIQVIRGMPQDKDSGVVVVSRNWKAKEDQDHFLSTLDKNKTYVMFVDSKEERDQIAGKVDLKSYYIQFTLANEARDKEICLDAIAAATLQHNLRLAGFL